MRLSKADMFLPEPPPLWWEAAGPWRERADTSPRCSWGRERLGAGRARPRQLVATLDGEGPRREASAGSFTLVRTSQGVVFLREWSVYFLIDVLFHLALVWNSRWGCNYCNLGNKHFPVSQEGGSRRLSLSPFPSRLSLLPLRLEN